MALRYNDHDLQCALGLKMSGLLEQDANHAGK